MKPQFNDIKVQYSEIHVISKQCSSVEGVITVYYGKAEFLVLYPLWHALYTGESPICISFKIKKLFKVLGGQLNMNRV